jgi:hypothetical protein
LARASVWRSASPDPLKNNFLIGSALLAQPVVAERFFYYTKLEQPALEKRFFL